jgi:hypothetical protein
LGIEKYATASRNSARSEAPWTGPQPKGNALTISNLASAFPLPWSHYVRLLSVKGAVAREFYHAEALRGGWSVRQLREGWLAKADFYFLISPFSPLQSAFRNFCLPTPSFFSANGRIDLLAPRSFRPLGFAHLCRTHPLRLHSPWRTS